MGKNEEKDEGGRMKDEEGRRAGQGGFVIGDLRSQMAAEPGPIRYRRWKPPILAPLERVMNFRRPWRFNSFRVGRSFFQ